MCELDAGIPRYHVPKFQMIAAMRSARTAHIPNAILELAILSRGRSFMIPIATPVPPMTTQRKLKNAASATAFFGEREFEYMTGATAFAVSWNQLMNSNAQTSARQSPTNMRVESMGWSVRELES